MTEPEEDYECGEGGGEVDAQVDENSQEQKKKCYFIPFASYTSHIVV